MLTRLNDCFSRESVSTKDAFFGAGLTLGSALVVAAIMVIGRSPVTEAIGIVMFPGVLAVGPQWIYMRGRSALAKVVLIGGPFLVLFLIGLLVGLTQGD